MTPWRNKMRYDVTYWAGHGEETAHVEAADAPTAAERVSSEHADDDGFFELLAVVRVPIGDPTAASGD